MSPQRSHKQTQSGLTLIEILVTLVILAVALLGMAALQLTGIRGANSSTYRTQATLLADDIAERMRANGTAVDDNRFSAVNSATIDCTAFPTPYCGEYYNGTSNVAAVSCTPAQMAAYDINIWYCGERYGSGRRGGVVGLLNSPSATITCIDVDPTGGDTDTCTNHSSRHTISITWNELSPDRNNGGANLTQTLRLSVQQ